MFICIGIIGLIVFNTVPVEHLKMFLIAGAHKGTMRADFYMPTWPSIASLCY